MANKIFVLLGSNQGDRERNLANAVRALEQLPAAITKTSKVYETAAWGNEQQDSFYNQAVLLEADIEPSMLMQKILTIEKSIGRERFEKWGPRIIDIDILLIDDRIIQSELITVPHPHLHERNFALIPLTEIAPDQIHPVLKKNIRTLLSECADTLPVTELQ